MSVIPHTAGPQFPEFCSRCGQPRSGPTCATCGPPETVIPMAPPPPAETVPPPPAYYATPTPGAGYGPQPPMMAGGGAGATTTSLRDLADQPRVVLCKHCGHTGPTNLDFVAGFRSHIFAFVFCIICCPLVIIPYVGMDGSKDVEHRCGRCGALLAKWERGGSVRTYQEVV